MSSPSFFDEDDEPSFFQRHRWKIIAVAVVSIGGGAWAGAKLLKGSGHSPRKPPEVTMVKLAPLPPPPPPPPPQQAPPEQKMIAQEPVNEPEAKAEPKPADEPPPDLGTGVKGDGPPDGFGLSGRGGTGRIGGSGAGEGSRRSKWGWYAGQVQSRIADSLRQNRKTRSARIGGLQVRVWPDQTGRIIRAQLAGSTGDPGVDAAIRSEVLTGLQLQEAPPQGMPMPIVLRLNARRPN